MEQVARQTRLEAYQSSVALRQFIEQQIAIKAWLPGARLPTERELAGEFNIGRSSVRRALADLEISGMIQRHVGRGTFVRELQPASKRNGADSRSLNPAEVMEVRLLIEPAMVDLIVARASQIELEELQEIVDKGGTARNMADFELWDARLHNAMVRASKNDYLACILSDIHAVRQMVSWGQLQRRGMNEERRAAYQVEHQAIVTALLDRDADTAKEVIKGHLTHVRYNLIGI